MCKLCREKLSHRSSPSRRSFVVGAASTIGMLLADTAGAEESRAPPKPQNVVSPDAALERLQKGNIALCQRRVAPSRFRA